MLNVEILLNCLYNTKLSFDLYKSILYFLIVIKIIAVGYNTVIYIIYSYI